MALPQPLEGQLDALCDALISRLLPALQPLLQEAANKAAMLALQSVKDLRPTSLGYIPPQKLVTVEWSFTNTSNETWPVGCRLRCLGGSLKPCSSRGSSEVIPPNGTLTLEAEMRAPSQPGPCDAEWQLETPDGRPLCPPIPVSALVPDLDRPIQPTEQAPDPGRFSRVIQWNRCTKRL